MTPAPVLPVRWLDGAYVDLAEISDFLSRSSVAAAVHVSDGIQDKADLLAFHPFLGERVPRRKSVRRLLWHDYVYYTVHSHEVIIRAVTHGARRSPARKLRDRLRQP